MKAYYAHPTSDYGSEQESLDIELIHALLGVEVVNPNEPEHEAAYLKLREETGHGMTYFTEQVLPSCDMCVLRSYGDGMIGAGVWLEALWFKERELPVYEIVAGQIQPFEFDESRQLNVADTRQRNKQLKKT